MYGRTVPTRCIAMLPATVLPGQPWSHHRALERNRRRRAVVVDSDRRVLNIITDGDLLRRTQKKRIRGCGKASDVVGRQSYVLVAVGCKGKRQGPNDNAGHYGVDHDTPAEALRLMVQHQVKRLPVVDEDSQLAGLLGRASLLRGLMDAKGSGESKAMMSPPRVTPLLLIHSFISVRTKSWFCLILGLANGLD